MAALTTQVAAIAAGFVFNEIWYEGGDGQRRAKCIDVNIPSGYGGSTNTIAAACFGLTTVEEVTSARISASDKKILVGPSYDRTKLFVYDLTQTTDANRSLPADTTAATRMIVKGKE